MGGKSRKGTGGVSKKLIDSLKNGTYSSGKKKSCINIPKDDKDKPKTIFE